MISTTWKNCLQEYCQKQKISLPNYRIKKQSGPAHILKFQVEVEVNGHWYIGDDLCSSKKEAEQSAAKKALEALRAGQVSPSVEQSTVSTLDAPPSYSEVVNTHSKYYLPSEYADIEQFIATKVEADGGRIRKISPPDSQGRHKFEISGSYRYCENIQRHHKKNQIFFIVDPVKRTYIQKCHDSDCYGFQSAIKYIDNDQRTNPELQEDNSTSKCSRCRKVLRHSNQNECERCGSEFCRNCLYECDLCHGASHCERCIDSCVECHDS